jgi:ABC-type uncharacterized transport system substrate-binding protein
MKWLHLTLALLGALALCAAPRPAQAHPHVFVEVALSFEADAQGRFTGVEVTWRYDALYTLLVLADRGMDLDADLRLTEEERDALKGFDLEEWPEGFNGALFVEDAAGLHALAPPVALDVRLEGDQLVTRHHRALVSPATAPLSVRPYDPSYYAALTLMAAPDLPEGCAARIIPPDSDVAQEKLDTLNSRGDEGVFEEVSLGIYFAETVEISCPRS